MIFDGSKSYFEPRPLHAGQAPYGELKLKERGSSCGTEMPQSGEASFSEKTWSLPPTMDTVTRPAASLSAVAMDCSRREAMPCLTSRRSMTTSRGWVLRLASPGGARGPRGGFLLDGDRGGEAFDDVDLRALHLVEELARVGREGFDVAALALGVNGVKG